jgi:hypothetical protein
MKVCVLRSEGALENPLAHLLPEAENVVLSKATIYRQLKALKRLDYDIFINLCWGDRVSDSAAYSEVVSVLEDLNLPHTGAGKILHDTPKNDMKHIAYFAGVDTPAFAVAERLNDIERACLELSFPMFVKPLVAIDRQGIDPSSCVNSPSALIEKANELIIEFDSVLIEEYTEGQEYAVLVVGNPADLYSPFLYPPLDCTSSRLCDDLQLSLSLQDAAKRIFLEMHQGGYACVEFRVNEGEILFLEVNAPCSVFSSSEHQPADRILSLDQAGQGKFLEQIMAEGIDRHQRQQKKYRVGKSAIATYGIFATQPFNTGDVIVPGEGSDHRIITHSYVQSHWASAKHSPLLRYVLPLGTALVLRGADPANWVLENHSCDPNTGYQGLDLIALREIELDEELTVDFAAFASEDMEGFDCMCGASQCRGAFEFPRCLSKPVSLNSLKAEMLCH